MTEEKCYREVLCVARERNPLLCVHTCETMCERPRGKSFIWMAMSFCRS